MRKEKFDEPWYSGFWLELEIDEVRIALHIGILQATVITLSKA
jgi:hypothetical protein